MIKTYYPLLLIFSYIIGVTGFIEVTSGGFDLMRWMSHFMGGFFLVFSFFKLLDIAGFAKAYGTYDIVAKKFKIYGYIYPVLELVLGILFVMRFSPLFTNVFTFVLMTVSTIGVIQTLRIKSDFQCACLGTIFKLPMTRITLFEDLLMVLMSFTMILMLI
jgi:hypothetical protein